MQSDQVSFPAPLPENAILVHIGMHKTGTTAAQSIFAANRESLLQRGIYYPGKGLTHHTPVRSLRQAAHGWEGDATPAPPIQVWEQFAADARAHHGRVVISSEFLANAMPAHIERLARDLGPERVHVVVGVRHFLPIAVSNWQQGLKRGPTASLDEWLHEQFERNGTEWTPFWQKQDCAATVRRWADVFGGDRITAVVVAGGRRGRLLRTFEHLLDLPQATLTGTEPGLTNRGMSAAEAEFVRRLNMALENQLGWRDYNTYVREGVIRGVVEGRQPGPGEGKPAAPEWVRAQAEREGKRAAEQLSEAGVRVVGDLDELVHPPEGTVPAPEEGGTADAVPYDLAVAATVGVLKAALAAEQRAAERERRLLEEAADGRHLSGRQALGLLFDRARRRVRRTPVGSDA